MKGSSAIRLSARIALLGAAIWFLSMDNNPVVRLEAVLGLSPSPLEKLAGLRGPFSGMTEGMHQLANGRLDKALEANVLTPIVAISGVWLLLLGLRPRIRTREQEAAFLGGVCVATLIVNLVHGVAGP